MLLKTLKRKSLTDRGILHAIILGLYLLLYFTVTAIILGWGFTSLVYESAYPSLSWSGGVGLLVYLITGVIFTVRFFPERTISGTRLLVPLAVNCVIFYLVDLSPESLPIRAYILSTSLFAGLILTVLVSLVAHPWIDTGKLRPSFGTIIMSKFRYLKENPTVLVGLLVLLLPLLSSVYFLLTGLDFLCEIIHSRIPKTAAILLYAATVLNVIIFHFREFSKYFSLQAIDSADE